MLFHTTGLTRTLLAAAVVLVGALLVAGCTGTGNGPATQAPTAAPTSATTSITSPVTTVAMTTPTPEGTAPAAETTTPASSGTASGRISVTGSTTVLPIAQKLADRFMELNPKADIRVSGGGSGVGVTSAGERTAEIGMSSRDLKDAERTKYPGLKEIPIARDGIAVITHPSNGVPSLSLDQIKSIYAGKATNWKDVGGKAQPIVVIGRDSASGTREFFNEKVMGKEATTKAMLEKNSNGAVKTSIGPNPGSIGYVGLGYIDESVRAVAISVNGTPVEPTVENIVKGTYPLSRKLYFVTNGDATGLAKEFIDFSLSPEGQAIVEAEGFVSITHTA